MSEIFILWYLKYKRPLEAEFCSERSERLQVCSGGKPTTSPRSQEQHQLHLRLPSLALLSRRTLLRERLRVFKLKITRL